MYKNEKENAKEKLVSTKFSFYSLLHIYKAKWATAF